MSQYFAKKAAQHFDTHQFFSRVFKILGSCDDSNQNDILMKSSLKIE